MFISAGNSGPGMNTVGDPGVCGKVLERRRVHHRRHVPGRLRAQTVRGRQPALLLARAARVRTAGSSRRSSRPARPSRRRRCGRRQPVASRRRCPPGYALLQRHVDGRHRRRRAPPRCSSARRRHTDAQNQPDQLRQAMHLVARFLTRHAIEAYEQGNGLIDVGAAWDLLKTNIKTVDIIFVGAGRTLSSSGFLATPGIGSGDLRARGRPCSVQSYTPDVHVHAQRRPRRHEDVQRDLERQ